MRGGLLLVFGCWLKKSEVGSRKTWHSAVGTTDMVDLEFIPGP